MDALAYDIIAPPTMYVDFGAADVCSEGLVRLRTHAVMSAVSITFLVYVITDDEPVERDFFYFYLFLSTVSFFFSFCLCFSFLQPLRLCSWDDFSLSESCLLFLPVAPSQL